MTKYIGFLETSTGKSQGSGGGIFETVSAGATRYGTTITVATGEMPSSQSDFVWLATESNFPTAAKDGGAQSILNGGGNLRCYTDDTKATQLPIEVVSFVTGGTPSIQVWGLSPTLNVASTVYIEADTVATTQPAVGAAFGRNAVYTSNDRRYHLNGDTGSVLVDATGNDNGVLQGSVVSGGEVAPYGAASTNFNGTGYYNGIVDPTVGQTHLAVGFWLNSTGTTTKSIIGSFNANTDSSFLVFLQGATSTLRFRIAQGGSTVEVVTTSTVGNDGIDHYIQLFYDNSNLYVYVDGVLEDSTARTGVIETPTTAPFNIGSWNDDLARSPDARVQELSVSTSTAITLNYQAAEYNNQSDPATFWTVGAWTDQDAGGGITGTITETGPSFTESVSATLTASINASIIESGPSFTESINTTLSVNITSTITEVGPSFTESISATVTATAAIIASITEQGPSFTESISANLDVNITALITELGPSFTESINISLTKDINASIIESGPSFTESIIASLPIVITVNPKSIIQVRRQSNSVTVKRQSNTVTIKRRSNTIRVK